MKILAGIIVALVFLGSAPYAHAQTNVPQGGTGLTSVPLYGLLVGDTTLRLKATTSPTVGSITATSTTATSSLQNTSITGAISLLGEYFTNFTTYVRSRFSATLPISIASGVISIADAVADGATKGAASFTAADFNSSAGNISIDYVNGQKATASVPGFLTAADWTTFNNKISSTSLTATFPLAYNSTTGAFTSAFSTTTNTGMSQGNVYIGTGGIMQTSASSSIFGYTPLNPTRQLTVAGTANQITSSAGAQDLSADRTWTLSLPSLVVFPGQASTTQLSAGRAYFGTTATSTFDTTGNLTIPSGSGFFNTGRTDGCASWVSGQLTSLGVACGTSSGGITAIGPAGQTQTGSTITFATSSSATNGLTPSLVITGSTNTLTFTSSISGTLTVAGGGTGQTSFTAGNLIYGSGSGALQNVATSTRTYSAEFSNTGTLGAQVGGTNSVVSLATNGVALTKIAQIAANTVLGNNTGASGNVVAFATSTLGIAISDTTGTLAVNRGGTGAITLTGVLKGNGASPFTAAVNGTDFTLISAISCTNQVITAFTAAGVGTCATVSNAMLANSTISGVALGGTLGALTATNSTLTFSGSYDGSAARTVGLNLGNANTWTVLQTFGNSSTTAASFAYASSTAGYFGTLNLPNISGTQCLQVISGVVSGTGSGCGSSGGTPGGSGTELQYRSGASTFGAISSSAYVAASNWLGIGTTTPKWLLTLASSTAPQIALSGADNSSIFTMQATGGSLVFGTSSPTTFAGNTTSALTIGDTGTLLVGYNGASGSYQLNVGNSASSNTNIAFGTKASGAYVNLRFTTASFPFGLGSIGAEPSPAVHSDALASALNLTTGGNGPIALSADGTGPNLVISTAGNVGVGTTSPYAKLSIGGDVVVGSATAGGTLGDLYLPKLGTAAGTFLAADASGKVIATTTPTGGSGITTISISSANGFAGSSSGGSTPALTISTSITGLLKGNGTAISAASNGTDFTLLAAQTCTNQAITALTAAGASTCSSITNSFISGQISVAHGGTGLSTFGGTNTILYTTAADTISSEAAFLYDPSVNRITVDFASTTAVSGTNSNWSGILVAARNIISGIAAAFTPSVEGELGFDTTDNQLKFFSGGAVRVVSPSLNASFTYATSTAWTGTTTIPLGPAYVAETWAGVKCFTDTGTVNVSFYDGTNRMNMLNASTTVGTITLNTNNSFTAGEKRYVDIGTPATTPTKISCTIAKTIDPT